jgi:hypothetical protein
MRCIVWRYESTHRVPSGFGTACDSSSNKARLTLNYSPFGAACQLVNPAQSIYTTLTKTILFIIGEIVCAEEKGLGRVEKI